MNGLLKALAAAAAAALAWACLAGPAEAGITGYVKVVNLTDERIDVTVNFNQFPVYPHSQVTRHVGDGREATTALYGESKTAKWGPVYVTKPVSNDTWTLHPAR
jgi:hypothetical protein